MRAALLVCVALLAACSSQDSSEPAPAPSTPPTSSPPTTEATDPPDPPTTEPLVLAVHVRRPPADLTRAQAGLLVDGGVRRWSQLGLPGGRLTVTRKVQRPREQLAPDTVAIVPASKVGPGVRALSVDGVDPLRDPDDYLLRVVGPEPGTVTTLTVVGDIMLGRRVGERAAEEGDPSYPLRPMQRRLRSADITVGNLEGTLSDDGAPTQGGDSFHADPAVREGCGPRGSTR